MQKLKNWEITHFYEFGPYGNVWVVKFTNIRTILLISLSSLGVDPLEVDPYESRTVEVRNSSVEDTSAGQGLFTKRNINKG